MVQFLSIIFFLGFLQFLSGFSKVPLFCVTLYIRKYTYSPTKYGVMIQQLTNIPGIPASFFINRSCKVQRQKPTRGGDLTETETYLL